MAEKRRQRSADSDETETQQKQLSKRPRNNNNSSNMTQNHNRPQHNQKMAQAALARIKKLDSKQPETRSIPTPSSSLSPQSSTSSSLTNTQNNHPLNPPDLLRSDSSATPDLRQQIKNLKDQIESINKTVSTYKEVVENQSNIIDSVKSSLSCNICLEVLESPYALLCGHIFCHKDLYAWFHRANPSSSDRYDSDTHDFDDDDDDDDDDDHDGHHHRRMGFGGPANPPREFEDHSSDSELVQTELNRAGPPNRAAGAANVNGTGRPNQPHLAGLMNDAHAGQNTNRGALQPLSSNRRRKNLICPQCRAAVIRRPMALYAVKEAADKLKTIGTPVPSSSGAAGSFRNLVEQHRDEKDLTWGQLFDADNNQDRALANLRRDPAEHRHVVVDLEDGVRRCSRCAWEIGANGICQGCQIVYPDLDGTDDEDDEDFPGRSDSEDMSTNYETEEEDGRSEEDEEMADQAAYFWSRPMGRVFPIDSGTDDGESMARLASRVNDSDGSSEVQVVRRVRRVFSESDSDVEARPNAAARRRAAEEESSRRRPVSISSLSSPPNSDRPEYSRSRDGQVVHRTGLAIARGGGRVPSSSLRDGYSSNLSEPGTPMHHDYHDRMADHSSDFPSDSDAHVPESSINPGRSDDEDEDEDGDDDGHSDHFGHGHAGSSGDTHSVDGSSSLDHIDHSSYDDEDSDEQDSDSDY